MVEATTAVKLLQDQMRKNILVPLLWLSLDPALKQMPEQEVAKAVDKGESLPKQSLPKRIFLPVLTITDKISGTSITGSWGIPLQEVF